MVMGIGWLRSVWPIKKVPLVIAPTPVTGARVETGSTEEQIRFSEGKRVQAGLYGKDGKLEDGPKLDGPP